MILIARALTFGLCLLAALVFRPLLRPPFPNPWPSSRGRENLNASSRVDPENRCMISG